MVTSPTRCQNILDLFFTTNPTLMANVSIIPGLSKQDIVLAQVIAKPETTKHLPCIIALYKKADWDKLHQSMMDVLSELKHYDLATSNVQRRWDKFTTRLQQGIAKFIPNRKTGTWDGSPRINQEIHRLIRKRDKLYKRCSRPGRPDDQSRFTEYKHLVRRVLDKTYGKYLGDILGLNTGNLDHDLGELPKVKKLLLAQALQTRFNWHCSLKERRPNSLNGNTKSNRLKRPVSVSV